LNKIKSKQTKYFLIFILFNLLLSCRPGTKKDECNSKLQDKEGVSFCAGGGFILPIFFRNPKLTEQERQNFLNVVLLDCLLLEEARQKCRDANSYQPTIY